MDLASFKARYPSFTDDVAIATALSDAELLITTFDIDDSKLELAIAYLTAHLLTVPQGASEPQVTKVKADTVEVQFSDKTAGDKDWLSLSSYGQLLALLIKPKKPKRKYGVVNNTDKHAITFDGVVNEQGRIVRADYD